MRRSFHVGTLYPPVQHRRGEVMRKEPNTSDKLYDAYLAEMARQDMATMILVQFARQWHMLEGKLSKRSATDTTAVGARYRFELNDFFLGRVRSDDDAALIEILLSIRGQSRLDVHGPLCRSDELLDAVVVDRKW